MNLKTGAQAGHGAWGKSEYERFNTPDSEKYNPTRPEAPSEEIEMSQQEIQESWNPSFSEAEREEQNEKWDELKEKQRKKERTIPPPLKQEDRRDGTRWSKDDIPNSEKTTKEYSFGEEYHPPEKQPRPQEAEKYWNPEPLVNSVVQLRNILQSGIQYVQDWFTYITQMIYDLLGTDFGWMSKKTGTSILKSRIIQLIMLVKSLLKAMSQNGLKCGSNSNFDFNQMKFVLEDGLNKYSDTKFEVQDNGDIKVIPPGGTLDSTDNSKGPEDTTETKGNDSGIDAGPDKGTIKVSATKESQQKSSESGIIIKNCLQDLTANELADARKWIASYEGRP